MTLRIVLAGCLAAALLWASPARADDDDDADDDSPEETVKAVVEKDDSMAGVQPVAGGPAKVGLVHDTLSRARKQPTLFQNISDEYSDFKTRMEDDHGLTWSFSLSYRQRWISPDNVGTSSQTLFWPSLNWDIFDSENFGSGSFQFLYYGERRSGSKVAVSELALMSRTEPALFWMMLPMILALDPLLTMMPPAIAAAARRLFELDDEATRRLSLPDLVEQTEQDARGNTTTYHYDAGRLTRVVDARNQTTQYGYDEAGNQTSVTDANNHTTQQEYDARRRLKP